MLTSRPTTSPFLPRPSLSSERRKYSVWTKRPRMPNALMTAAPALSRSSGMTLLRIDDIHDRLGEGVACLEDDVVVLIGNAVEGNDIAGNEFLHDVLGSEILLIEIRQLFIILDFPCRACAYTAIRFDDDRIADLRHEFLSFFQCGGQVISGNRHAGFVVVGFHIRLALETHDIVGIVTAFDIEIGTQSCVLLEPEFVVGFQPVDFSVLVGEPGDSSVHLVVIHHGVDTVVFSACVFHLLGKGIPAVFADA